MDKETIETQIKVKIGKKLAQVKKYGMGLLTRVKKGKPAGNIHSAWYLFMKCDKIVKAKRMQNVVRIYHKLATQ